MGHVCPKGQIVFIVTLCLRVLDFATLRLRQYSNIFIKKKEIFTFRLIIICFLLCPIKSHSKRSLARVKLLLQEENGGNMSECWRGESILCWTTDSVIYCCLKDLGGGVLELR